MELATIKTFNGHVLSTKFIQGIGKKDCSQLYKNVLANELNLVTFDLCAIRERGGNCVQFHPRAKLLKYHFETHALSPRKYNTISVCSESLANPTYKLCE
jgi:hypothetical protein